MIYICGHVQHVMVNSVNVHVTVQYEVGYEKGMRLRRNIDLIFAAPD